MSDTKVPIPHQIAHLEAMAATMREDLAEAWAGLLAKPGDERLAKQVGSARRSAERSAEESAAAQGAGMASVIGYL